MNLDENRRTIDDMIIIVIIDRHRLDTIIIIIIITIVIIVDHIDRDIRLPVRRHFRLRLALEPHLHRRHLVLRHRTRRFLEHRHLVRRLDVIVVHQHSKNSSSKHQNPSKPFQHNEIPMQQQQQRLI